MKHLPEIGTEIDHLVEVEVEIIQAIVYGIGLEVEVEIGMTVKTTTGMEIEVSLTLRIEGKRRGTQIAMNSVISVMYLVIKHIDATN